jgi:hypothetical protein
MLAAREFVEFEPIETKRHTMAELHGFELLPV